MTHAFLLLELGNFNSLVEELRLFALFAPRHSLENTQQRSFYTALHRLRMKSRRASRFRRVRSDIDEQVYILLLKLYERLEKRGDVNLHPVPLALWISADCEVHSVMDPRAQLTLIRVLLLPKTQSWVPPRPSVLRKGLEQRGEDTAVRVGEVIRFVQRIGGSQRVSQQRAAAAQCRAVKPDMKSFFCANRVSCSSRP
ncbi:hypothetical protein EYF80_027545 [Liparis tanakae]|uniref:Uncharacterized protein n=1 Tax=Liparis tanakae TaxID=230148 RepID=A0A4Z2H9J5_9TELE|nr:hypothetical protein EYF80_027545 [Liparis tanakae]